MDGDGVWGKRCTDGGAEKREVVFSHALDRTKYRTFIAGTTRDGEGDSNSSIRGMEEGDISVLKTIFFRKGAEFPPALLKEHFRKWIELPAVVTPTDLIETGIACWTALSALLNSADDLCWYLQLASINPSDETSDSMKSIRLMHVSKSSLNPTY